MKSDISSKNNSFDYKDVPLLEWIDTFEEKKKQEHFDDQDSFYKAYNVLFDINKISKAQEDDVCDNR